MKSLGIIGYGNMGEAMVRGVRKKLPSIEINVIEKIEARRALAVKKAKAKDFGEDYKALLAASDVVIIAVKPQDIEALMQKLASYSTGKKLISILAGKQISYFKGQATKAEVARFMPSLAASVGKSVVGISYSPDCSADFKKDAQLIADSIGAGIEIPERLMPAITGVSGSGIAFAFEFINAMTMAGVRAGFAHPASLKIALDVIEGAVQTLRAEGLHPADMISRVCSPAGTTIEGMYALEAGGFKSAVSNAVSAAAHRARELEN
jgi:pyrroline-5-carboxylate reductase